MSKYFYPVAVRRDVITHIFDNTQYGYVYFLKHSNALADNAKRRFLRGGYYDATVQRHSLAKRKLGIACSRRQIHDEVIQLTPLH